MVYFSGLEPLLEAHPGVVDLLEIEPQTTWLERPDRPGEIWVQPEVEAHLASLPYRKLVHSVGTPVGGSVPGIEAQLPLLRNCVKMLGRAMGERTSGVQPDAGFFYRILSASATDGCRAGGVCSGDSAAGKLLLRFRLRLRPE